MDYNVALERMREILSQLMGDLKKTEKVNWKKEGFLISTNDTSILAMVSRYPNIPDLDADRYLLQIEHEENREICEVLLGREPEESLDQDQLRTYKEFQRWSFNRTQRIRNEQVAARRRNVNTRLRDRLLQQHREGLVSDEVLQMYAIQGDLLTQQQFHTMTAEEKQRWWEERVESNLGVNWRAYLGTLADFIKMPEKPKKVNWAKEGF